MRTSDIKDLFSKYGFNLSDKEVKQFNDYYDFLVSENKKYNLTSITAYNDVLVKHFLDSVIVTKYFDFSKVKTVCDIGTGAGFPLVPIKILFPHLDIYLVDSLNKRINFLNELCTKLELENFTLVHDRAENFGHSEYREMFDLSINRAVANLSVLCEYCLPVTKEGGTMLVLKSNEIAEELDNSKKAVTILGGELINTTSDINIEGNLRSLIEIKKISTCPLKYPRKAGIPVKRPL